MGCRAEDGRAGTCRVEEDEVRRPVRRRIILTAGAWSALAWTQSVFPQSKQPVLVGVLNSSSREVNGSNVAAFKDGLAALGWKEGSQVVFEERWANGRADRLPSLAAELKAKRPTVIATAPLGATIAAAKGVPDTPVVQLSGSSPVAAGVAASFARPGSMVTGLSHNLAEVSEKNLELLLAAVPNLKRVGFLVDSTSVNRMQHIAVARRSAAPHSIEASIVEMGGPEEVEPAFSRLAKQGVQGLVVLPNVWLDTERQRILKLAMAQRWPVVGAETWVVSGALVGYGVDVSAMYRRAAWYVDKILRGAKPGDLPIEQPTKFELVVNMKTAKVLGLTIPQPFLMRADRVIE